MSKRLSEEDIPGESASANDDQPKRKRKKWADADADAEAPAPPAASQPKAQSFADVQAEMRAMMMNPDAAAEANHAAQARAYQEQHAAAV